MLGGQGATVEAAMRADLCRRAWRAQTYSSRDTPETVTEVKANNVARDAYCGEDGS